MSVRVGIAKLAMVIAGGALVSGGAVHVAEKMAAGKPQYVKHAKQAKPPVHRVVHVPPPSRALLHADSA
jgi:hypothetical protein